MHFHSMPFDLSCGTRAARNIWYAAMHASMSMRHALEPVQRLQACPLLMQSENGGSTNAYTSSESTNYHFDVNHDHLEGALDRFAQFFISPTISQDGVEREVNAVDSEYGPKASQRPSFLHGFLLLLSAFLPA